MLLENGADADHRIPIIDPFILDSDEEKILGPTLLHVVLAKRNTDVEANDDVSKCNINSKKCTYYYNALGPMAKDRYRSKINNQKRWILGSGTDKYNLQSVKSYVGIYRYLINACN